MNTKNRIQIDGEWYVKEIIATPPESIELSDLTFTKECIYGTDDYLWIASKIARTHYEPELVETDYYEGIDIKFTNKNTSVEEYWDNTNWILGVYHNDKESIKIAKESMSIKGIETFRKYVKSLIVIGWLIDDTL
jgi:hypothetical protein